MEDINLVPYSAPRLPATQQPPTPRDIVAVGFRHGWLMVISFLGVFLGVAVVTWVMPPRYDAQVKLMVKRERIDPVLGTTQNMQIIPEDMTEQDLNSEVELLKSRDLMERVVLETGLHKEGKTSVLRSMLLKLSRQTQERSEQELRIMRAAASLQKDLVVEPLKKTKLVRVTYGSRDPQLSAKVLQTLVHFYLEKHLAVHRLPGALDFFHTQTEQYRNGLSDAEAKLAEFGRTSGVVAGDLEKDITVRRLNEFEAGLQQTQAAIKETEQRIRILEQQVASTQARLTTQVKTADNVFVLQQMKTTLLNLELKRTELLSKFTPEYRPVQEVEAQIAQAREALENAERNPSREETTDRDNTHEWLVGELARSRAELSTLQARLAANSEIVKTYREQVRRLNETGLQQQDLIRAAKTAEENFLLYTRKQEEARISDALDQQRIVNVSVAEEPTVPGIPSSPSWPLNLALGFVMACFISLALGFGLDYLDRSFRTPREVEIYLGIPVLASLPQN